MNQLDKLIADAKSNTPVENKPDNVFIEMNQSPRELIKIEDGTSSPCHIPMISHMFSWKKHFSYLFSGGANVGKSTYTAYLMILKSLIDGWKWCIWTPEMEDAMLVGKKKVNYHMKDFINLLVWTLTSYTPFEYVSKKRDLHKLSDKEILTAYEFINDHFKFVHMYDRTPGGILEAFRTMSNRYDIDGFQIDPWKSVRQDMNKRDDLWLEDTLSLFKEFSFETDSLLMFIVHPKTLRDSKITSGDEAGEYRVITPYDLNGGAAWNNSMDVIVSLRPIMKGRPYIHHLEMYTSKARKQHIFGVKDVYKEIYFNTKRYRYYFSNEIYCPIEKRSVKNDEYKKRDNGQIVAPY